MSSASGILLDRASNVKIFEKLASAHLIDNRRLEEVKQMNHMSDLPIGRNTNIVVEPDTWSQKDDDSIDEIIADGLNIEDDDDAERYREASPRSQPMTPVEQTRQKYSSPGRSPGVPSDNQYWQRSHGGPRFGMSVERATPSPSSSARPSPRESPRESPRASPRESPRASQSPRESPRASPRPTGRYQRDEPPQQALLRDRSPELAAPLRTGPPPLPTNDNNDDGAYYAKREFERIRQSATEPDLPFGRLPAFAASATVATQSSQREAGYTTMFRDMCKRRHQYMSDRGVVGDGEYRAGVDPDYAEKRELLIKLDEMRHLGFNIPKLDPSLPIEDLQTELARRTVSMGTVEMVDTVIKWICTGANILEVVNNMTGPFIPMENYAQSVKEGTQTPRFKYALYQLTLRFQGRSGGSPIRVVIMVLLMPLIQGLLIKLVQWLAKGRMNVSSNMISTGVRTLFNQFTGAKDPNAGVPNGIPGISPDMPASVSKNEPELPRVPSMGNFRPNPDFANVGVPAAASTKPEFPPTVNVNPFSRMRADEGAKPAPAPSTATPKPSMKRPRLQKPNELLSEVSSVANDIPSGVVTAGQRANGKIRF
jgi:hypothetical protein